MSEADDLPALDLRLTQEDPDNLYEHAPCGYGSCLPDGTFVKLNQTLLSWLGYQREELVARQCLQQLLTIGGRLHYETHGLPLLLIQGHVRELSYSLRRKDGTTLPVLLNAQLQRDSAGQPLVVRITLFDITDRRRYEQELLRAKVQAEEQSQELARANDRLQFQNKQLTRINADLDSFVYTASHDLKQPIHNMTGLFAEFTRTATFHDSESAGMVSMFEEALQQLLVTIEGLQEVVQQQRQLEQLPVEAVPLKSLTEEIVRGLQAQAVASGATFTLDFAAAPLLQMPRPGLYSILYNLLSNALKYADPSRRPRIHVSTAREGSTLMLSIEDNGRGINLERHGHELFQLFRRFHPDVDGSGLGLYLVNRLVYQAGGRVEVTSKVDKGTQFRLYLPQ